MNEIWRDIKGYEGLYQVSSLGRIKSLPRYEIGHNGKKHSNIFFRKGGMLKPNDRGNGYLHFVLSKNGKQKTFYIHRLVGMAFQDICGEWFDGAVINHKDENPLNNAASNLEWCSRSYNTKYGNSMNKMLSSRNKNQMCSEKQVIQLTLDGEFVAEYKSIAEAGRQNGINIGNIGSVCRGERKSSGGFLWQYKEVA